MNRPPSSDPQASLSERDAREEAAGESEPPAPSSSSSSLIPPSVSRGPMRCMEIMRRPVFTIGEADEVTVAARRMRDEDIGFLPVCDVHGVVVGILTDRDIVTRAYADVVASDGDSCAMPVRKVMTRGVIACQPDDLVQKALGQMRKHRVTRVLIVDLERRPLGVLSLSDVVQYESAAKVGRVLRAISERKYASKP